MSTFFLTQGVKKIIVQKNEKTEYMYTQGDSNSLDYGSKG